MLDARFMGIAVLTGFTLNWQKRSDDGSGKCDAVTTGSTDSKLYGVLYDIPAKGKSVLDKV